MISELCRAGRAGSAVFNSVMVTALRKGTPHSPEVWGREPEAANLPRTHSVLSAPPLGDRSQLRPHLFPDSPYLKLAVLTRSVLRGYFTSTRLKPSMFPALVSTPCVCRVVFVARPIPDQARVCPKDLETKHRSLKEMWSSEGPSGCVSGVSWALVQHDYTGELRLGSTSRVWRSLQLCLGQGALRDRRLTSPLHPPSLSAGHSGKAGAQFPGL